MKQNIIGREKEIARLEQYMQSPKSEFIALYGRRRVGKTFLVKELLEGQFSFRITGREKTTTQEQLANFNYAFHDFSSLDEKASDWIEAFNLLKKYLKTATDGVKLLFFDELPWLDTARSGFLSALEHFWNDWAIYRNDIKLIVCGSATTWMLSKVINSRGGLHNRVTHKIPIAPFTLAETELYFQSEGFPYERQEILESYMAVGGVAYYLTLFERDKSVAENIDQLCFSRNGDLRDEFDKLYKALFKKADSYVKIITALNKKNKGMTRLELLDATKLVNNGNFTKKLEELEACDFIRSYNQFGNAKKEKLYQLIDPFSLFYFKFMHDKGNFMKNYWLKMQSTDEYHNWCGYAFEIVCLNHLDEIVHALGIDGCINTPCSWSYRPEKSVMEDDETDEDLKHGTQIDLLIDRSDKCINICEMKFSQSEYEIDKRYYEHLQQRSRIFKKVTHTKKSIVPIFVTSQGLYNNMYSRKITKQITADDLF